jgi:hypothetical protein
MAIRDREKIWGKGEARRGKRDEKGKGLRSHLFDMLGLRQQRGHVR